jgi:hypothetical protein
MQENYVHYTELPPFLRPSVDLFEKEHEYYSDVGIIVTGKKGEPIRPDLIIKQ